ncbi:hypothetical protein [Devosia sp. DBB001]|nr:hypothetical protein [Devosia sp. DBB001]
MLSIAFAVKHARHENRQRNLHYRLHYYPLTHRARRGFLHPNIQTIEDSAPA